MKSLLAPTGGPFCLTWNFSEWQLSCVGWSDTSMEKQYITKTQAAANADVSEKTIERNIQRGKLKAEKFYGRVLISESDFDAFLARRANASAPSSGVHAA
jgi:excisionase family DNA binding protein